MDKFGVKMDDSSIVPAFGEPLNNILGYKNTVECLGHNSCIRQLGLLEFHVLVSE